MFDGVTAPSRTSTCRQARSSPTWPVAPATSAARSKSAATTRSASIWRSACWPMPAPKPLWCTPMPSSYRSTTARSTASPAVSRCVTLWNSIRSSPSLLGSFAPAGALPCSTSAALAAASFALVMTCTSARSYLSSGVCSRTLTPTTTCHAHCRIFLNPDVLSRQVEAAGFGAVEHQQLNGGLVQLITATR